MSHHHNNKTSHHIATHCRTRRETQADREIKVQIRERERCRHEDENLILY
jgi:hypothetical protein